MTEIGNHIRVAVDREKNVILINLFIKDCTPLWIEYNAEQLPVLIALLTEGLKEIKGE